MHGIAQGGPLCSSMTYLLATIVMDERARITLSFLQECCLLDVLGKIHFSSRRHFSCHFVDIPLFIDIRLFTLTFHFP